MTYSTAEDVLDAVLNHVETLCLLALQPARHVTRPDQAIERAIHAGIYAALHDSILIMRAQMAQKPGCRGRKED